MESCARLRERTSRCRDAVGGRNWRAGILAVVSIAASVLAGCSAVPWSALQTSTHPSERTREGYLDLRGVTHVHTRMSRDSGGSLAEVVRAANRAGLDFISFAEHRRKSSYERESDAPSIDGVTLIPGWELGASGGSLLMLGVSERPPHFESTNAAIDWAHQRGGLAFGGHIERWDLAREPEPLRGLDGMEIVNLHAEIRARRYRFSLAALLLPASRALRTLLSVRPSNLATWEGLAQANGLIGGTDAHAKLRLLGHYGTLDRYVDVFRALTTHVHSEGRDMDAILEALRAGRSYVAFEALARVDRFEFEPSIDQVTVLSPRVADHRLICDGEVVAEEQGQTVRFASPAGVRRCRVEARLRGRLWVLTAYRELLPRRRRSE